MDSVLLASRLCLAAVFAIAGVAKLLDLRGTREALAGFGVPGFALPAGGLLLPLAELATAIALVPKASAQWGGVAAVLVLFGFIVGIANALARGEAPDCHCFGQLHSDPAGRGTLIRNIALAALAGLVAIDGPGPSLSAWVSDRIGGEPAFTHVEGTGCSAESCRRSLRTYARPSCPRQSLLLGKALLESLGR